MKIPDDLIATIDRYLDESPQGLAGLNAAAYIGERIAAIRASERAASSDQDVAQLDMDARLRTLVSMVCNHTPMLIAGQWVAINESDRTPITRKELATYEELLGALEFEIRVLQLANVYLRSQIPRISPNASPREIAQAALTTEIE